VEDGVNTYLGIDPGLSGALAFYDVQAQTLEVMDMPTFNIKRGRSVKREIDYYNMATIIDGRARQIRLAVVESVHSMPKQGVSSSFAFGESFGAAKMVVAASLIPMRLLPAHQWKAAVTVTKDKDSSRRRATQLFPMYAHLFARVKDDGRAEAALLAWLASRLPT
jgi:crossover junction endodeoxyribonuclease RuvC